MGRKTETKKIETNGDIKNVCEKMITKNDFKLFKRVKQCRYIKSPDRNLALLITTPTKLIITLCKVYRRYHKPQYNSHIRSVVSY